MTGGHLSDNSMEEGRQSCPSDANTVASSKPQTRTEKALQSLKDLIADHSSRTQDDSPEHRLSIIYRIQQAVSILSEPDVTTTTVWDRCVQLFRESDPLYKFVDKGNKVTLDGVKHFQTLCLERMKRDFSEFRAYLLPHDLASGAHTLKPSHPLVQYVGLANCLKHAEASSQAGDKQGEDDETRNHMFEGIGWDLGQLLQFGISSSSPEVEIARATDVQHIRTILQDHENRLNDFPTNSPVDSGIFASTMALLTGKAVALSAFGKTAVADESSVRSTV